MKFKFEHIAIMQHLIDNSKFVSKSICTDAYSNKENQGYILFLIPKLKGFEF